MKLDYLRALSMMKTRQYFALSFFVSFILSNLSCLSSSAQPLKMSGAQDSATDTALNTLPPKGKTEIDTEVEEMEVAEKNDPDKILQDLRKKQKEEEMEYLHHSITETQTVDRQSQSNR